MVTGLMVLSSKMAFRSVAEGPATCRGANKKSTIVRSEQTFAEYIKDPRAKVHGTKMIFADIENEQRKHKKITQRCAGSTPWAPLPPAAHPDQAA